MKRSFNLVKRLFSFGLRFICGWFAGLALCLFSIRALTAHWIPLKWIGLLAVLCVLLGLDILYQLFYRWYRKFRGLPKAVPLFGIPTWWHTAASYYMSQYLLPLGLLFALPVIVFCLDFRLFPTALFTVGEILMFASAYRLSKRMDHDPILNPSLPHQ